MTTYEHALLGINGLLATGLQERYGWKLVAVAGVAAVAPDWDGLPMLFDMSRFEHVHRVWGHNLLACLLTGMFLGSLDYRFDLVGSTAKLVSGWGPMKEIAGYLSPRKSRSISEWMVWMLVAFLAALSQIPADALVSGGIGLADWKLRPLWPFSNWEFIYPMVPWGNVGITIIFTVGMFAQITMQKRVQTIAACTLLSVGFFVCCWGNFLYE